MSRRGRPRKHKRFSIAELEENYLEAKQLSKSWLNRQRILQIISSSIRDVALEMWEIVSDKSTLNRNLEGYRAEFKGFGFGDLLRITPLDPGKEVVIDLDHDPPRIRIVFFRKEKGVTYGKETALKCPDCASNLVIDGINIYCQNGCFNWKIDEVKNVLREYGYIN